MSNILLPTHYKDPPVGHRGHRVPQEHPLPGRFHVPHAQTQLLCTWSHARGAYPLRGPPTGAQRTMQWDGRRFEQNRASTCLRSATLHAGVQPLPARDTEHPAHTPHPGQKVEAGPFQSSRSVQWELLFSVIAKNCDSLMSSESLVVQWLTVSLCFQNKTFTVCYTRQET